MTKRVFALLRVVAGGMISFATQYIIHWREIKKNKYASAALLVVCLEKYAAECMAIVEDDGTSEGQPAGQTAHGERYLAPTRGLPEVISYPDDIDWKGLPSDITTRSLGLIAEAIGLNKQISVAAEHAFPPDVEEFFHVRRLGYAKICLEVLRISRKLRKKYGIEPKINNMINPEFDDIKYLEEFIEREEKKKNP